MAMLMVELVRRDLDYGRFCHDEFYTDEVAGYLQQGKEYEVCIDFVRIMLKKQNRRIDNEQEGTETPQREHAEVLENPDASS
jgi:hypothetical protein